MGKYLIVIIWLILKFIVLKFGDKKCGCFFVLFFLIFVILENKNYY